MLPDLDETKTIAAGCLAAMASALITALMLFINGAFVMAVLTAAGEALPEWEGTPNFNQFMVFTIPVGMVIIQWMMIDYVRTRLTRIRPVDSAE